MSNTPDGVHLHLSFDEDNPPACVADLLGNVEILRSRVDLLEGLCSGGVVDILAVQKAASSLKDLAEEVDSDAQDLVTSLVVTA